MRFSIQYPRRQFSTPDKGYLTGVHRQPTRPGDPDAVVLAMRCGTKHTLSDGEARTAELRLSLDEARQLRAALEHLIDGGEDALPRVIVDGASSWDIDLRPSGNGEVEPGPMSTYTVTNGSARLMPYAMVEATSLTRAGVSRLLPCFLALKPGERGKVNVFVAAGLGGLGQTGDIRLMTVPVPPKNQRS